ncbi:hypothetical protein A3K86_17845 [Photobacterium jeanii]|uniref:Bacterial surface antigen (D15) domain-containing protein n=1 Tax=Photobacterium jeanii TaxID=858640 RepID=A0A178K172_9GAMM|nr:BamA/TamA family outer membrane protein [Photobacterium jeanii]OAN10856.1 hypothetical protein A3K86_17845 [Photobacterium jeanii]PST90371.1 glyceraldehyde-3-phosphate dehydrogenase [Photobacterium jeanii]
MNKAALALTCAIAAGFNPSSVFANDWIDPVDGQLDASKWLLDNAYGFMPFPIMLTDPDIGNGGGAALLFFHETDEQKKVRTENPDKVASIAPSVSGLVALGTDNGSNIYGGFHNGVWNDDTIRYEGGAYKANLNVQFYGFGDATKMNVDGMWIYQKINFRLGKKSNWWLGADYNYTSGDITFDNQKDLKLTDKDSTLGVKLAYDSLDNKFSPEQGIKAGLTYTRAAKALGGDFDYDKLELDVQSHHKLNEQWIASWRTKAINLSDGAAFYNKPSIDLRGMANLRHQGNRVFQGEAQLTYKIDPRWSVLGFAGAGTAYDNDTLGNKNPKFHGAYGAGFRHLVARQLGLKWGVDVAQSKDESTVTLQFGSAW